MKRRAETVKPLLWVVLAVSFHSACASTRHAARPPASPDLAAQAALQAALSIVREQAQDYRISPYDLLEVSVYQEKDLFRQVLVNPSGKVSLPLAGEVEVAGLTLLEAEAKLAGLFKAYLIDPHVSIFTKEYHSQKVFVLGEVTKPGAYAIPVDRPMTVVEAIAVAGGFTKIAAPDKTRVVRGLNGHAQYLTIPVRQIASGDGSEDLTLKPGDVIFVPQAFF